MRKMNKVIAVLMGIIAAMSAYGVVFMGAYWHVATFLICGFLALMFWADSETPDNTGLSGI